MFSFHLISSSPFGVYPSVRVCVCVCVCELIRTVQCPSEKCLAQVKSAHTALAVKACLLGGNSNTKCSMTLVNIAVAISALAGGGPKNDFARSPNFAPRPKYAVYVENIFRDNFLRFSPPLQAKTVEKPTFFNIAKVQFCAAEGPETL